MIECCLMKRLTGKRNSGSEGPSIRRAAALPLKAALLMLVAALMLAASWGCGEETVTVEEIVVEEDGADGTLTPAGEDADGNTVDIPDADLSADGDALLPEHLPTATGTQLEYLANEPGDSTPVSFNLNGPWNFTSGASDNTLRISLISKATAPSQDQFPEATTVARSSWDPPPGLVEYSFQNVNGNAWLAYGRFGPDDRLRTFSAPVRVLVFPGEIGSTWTEIYTETEGDRVIDIQADNLIVSRNRLTVPAGTFDAFLLQTLVTVTEDGVSIRTWDYIWIVPGIGRAAEIISLPDEDDDQFENASAFYRLSNINNP